MFCSVFKEQISGHPIFPRQLLYNIIHFILSQPFFSKKFYFFRKGWMGLSGLEPPTSRLSGVRSNQLSYRPLLMERVKGIEPSSSAWKAEVLPLNYTRIIEMVGKTGFEPAAPWSQTKCSTKLSYFPPTNAPERSRTPNLLIRSQTLYPIELRAQKTMVPRTGIEPVR